MSDGEQLEAREFARELSAGLVQGFGGVVDSAANRVVRTLIWGFLGTLVAIFAAGIYVGEQGARVNALATLPPRVQALERAMPERAADRIGRLERFRAWIHGVVDREHGAAFGDD